MSDGTNSWFGESADIFHSHFRHHLHFGPDHRSHDPRERARRSLHHSGWGRHPLAAVALRNRSRHSLQHGTYRVLVRLWLVGQHGRLAGLYYVYSRCATRLGTGRLWNFAATLWLWWSLWVFGELSMDALHAYSDVPLHHDAGYFVRLTGMNPAVASITILAVMAILGVPFVRVAKQTLGTKGFGG